MSTITFDTLAYVRKLEAAGVPRLQAEAQADAFSAAVSEGVASKADIERLERKIDILERDLKIWFGTAMVAAVGVILAAIRYLPPHS